MIIAVATLISAFAGCAQTLNTDGQQGASQSDGANNGAHSSGSQIFGGEYEYNLNCIEWTDNLKPDSYEGLGSLIPRARELIKGKRPILPVRAKLAASFFSLGRAGRTGPAQA